ncbi:hypothetical protein B0I37DRAFT_21086 [Chaetomium sp. MPI-CAGE-AT-0009]|nr:hypothetical protein B0I37DRAFT_21086 [Chaetomium sp. MPI-CAGE-AT-0009]
MLERISQSLYPSCLRRHAREDPKPNSKTTISQQTPAVLVCRARGAKQIHGPRSESSISFGGSVTSLGWMRYIAQVSKCLARRDSKHLTNIRAMRELRPSSEDIVGLPLVLVFVFAGWTFCILDGIRGKGPPMGFSWSWRASRCCGTIVVGVKSQSR